MFSSSISNCALVEGLTEEAAGITGSILGTRKAKGWRARQMLILLSL